ncbi:MAG: hypothetical protein WCB10_18355 [Steroidobacteraceae bacterium]
MTKWQSLKKIMSNRTTARLGLPIAVLVLGILAAPYAAGALAFLVRPGTAAFLGGFIAVLLFRVLSPDRR